MPCLELSKCPSYNLQYIFEHFTRPVELKFDMNDSLEAM